MKKIYLLLLSIIILSGNLFSQVFNLSPTQHGYIFTDEMSSTIYLFQDDKLEELVSAPGCGNYFQVSSDGNKVGFKLIEDGIQIPCVIDLNSKTIIRFNDPVIKCGQVNFDEKNNPAFTIDKDLHYIKDGKAYIYHLGYYANIAPISPNGEFVVF
ncbi:MAG: hypothetical protein JXA68_02380, partial [Ignavibacteriales bacterium]|nr:hypothetical protein [Ignavibacteriales bacterium]